MTDGEPTAMSDPVRIERTKLTAGYVNAAAGSLLTAGVVAPIAAALWGFGPSGSVSALTLVTWATIFLAMSVAAHAAARYILRGVEP